MRLATPAEHTALLLTVPCRHVRHSVGGKEFAESLAADVQRLLVTGTVRPVVRKKAALCLLRLFRRNPDVLNKEEWCVRSL